MLHLQVVDRTFPQQALVALEKRRAGFAPGIPDQRDVGRRRTRAHDALDLAARTRGVEPVERLRRDHRADAALGETGGFGMSWTRREPFPSSQRALGRDAHARVGLHCGDAQPSVQQQRTEDPGAASQIRHLVASFEDEHPLHEVDHVGRITRTMRHVLGHPIVETRFHAHAREIACSGVLRAIARVDARGTNRQTGRHATKRGFSGCRQHGRRADSWTVHRAE